MRYQHFIRRYAYREEAPPFSKHFYRKCGILVDLGEDDPNNNCIFEHTKTKCASCKVYQRHIELLREEMLARHLGYRAKP